jgi:RNA polymerase sigma factor (sigma-70 family)
MALPGNPAARAPHYIVVSDRQLLRRAQAGDRSALAILIHRHYTDLLSVCQRALRDRELARDAAQEATVTAMLGLHRLRDPERFGAWLIGIGLNICRSFLRARVRSGTSLDQLLDEGRLAEPRAPDADPADRAEVDELGAHVREAIAGLPAGQREAVTLFYLGGLTHAEIAGRLATRPGAVKTRLHKARRNLRPPLGAFLKEGHVMPSSLVPMRIADVRRTNASELGPIRNVIVLQEVDGERRLALWVGNPEAISLAGLLEDVELPRPGTHEFAARLLAAAGATLREVRIVELSNQTFFSQAVLSDGTSVDSRPSDALALAVHLDVPIYASEAVLQQTSADPPADLEPGADAKALAEETRERLRTESMLLKRLVQAD